MLIPSYEQYQESGGILEHAPFKKLLRKAEIDIQESKMCAAQVTAIAQAAKIDLDGAGNLSNETVAVYKLLRTNAIADVYFINHHRGMCDIQIFADALRIVQDDDSLEKLSRAFPHISFGKNRDS